MRRQTARWLVAVALLAPISVMATPDHPVVIAHRGASGYLPEHTLPAKALAHAQGADFIEQDVVLTRDGVPVVLHDIHLDRSTDVAEVYPDRARDDGRWYAIDFSRDELRRLRAWERRDATGAAAFPRRFPAGPGLSPVPTLAEEIAFIDGLNLSSGRQAGLYIELKDSAFHAREGQDLPAAVVGVLQATGWLTRREQVILQSFEPPVLERLRGEFGVDLPLVQLIGENDWAEPGAPDYDFLRTDAGLDAVAAYADGIGPWLMQLYKGRDADGRPRVTNLAARARARGLAVHPYTFRADQLPPGIDSFDDLHRLFIIELGVDGIFTDFPDRSRAIIDALLRTSPQ